MPINRTDGELIGDLGPDYKVMPLDLYANSAEFAEACKHACEKFKDAGAIETPLRFNVDDVIAQFYPRAKPAPLLVFLFCKKCRGGHDSAEGPKREDMPVERFVTYQFSVIDTPHAPGHA